VKRQYRVSAIAVIGVPKLSGWTQSEVDIRRQSATGGSWPEL